VECIQPQLSSKVVEGQLQHRIIFVIENCEPLLDKQMEEANRRTAKEGVEVGQT